MVPQYDVCVVGAGLVGLATAYALSVQDPGVSMIVVDKADRVAAHQSGHNSGVIHSGLFYKPGSLKAELCVEGRQLMYEFCSRHDVPCRQLGKLVIATDSSELPALDELERRGRANGLEGIERVRAGAIHEIEPAAVGIDALYVPESGITDYSVVAARLAGLVEKRGANVATERPVTRIDHANDGVRVTAGESTFTASFLVNCAGLHADRVAAMAGVVPSVRIVPFRGEYYRLSERSDPLVRALIYPVPDPRLPFLGVHFTRRIDGSVEVGPNAVLAFGREHYRGTSAHWGDVRETLTFGGFHRLAGRHWRSGVREMLGSRSRRWYSRAARKLVPAIRADDLIPGGSGVRAQAVSPTGDLVDDFVIETVGSTIHVLNAPSPAATASLAIGRYIASAVESVRRP